MSLSDVASRGPLSSGSVLVTSLVNEAQPVLKIELGDRLLVRDYDKLQNLEMTIVEIEGRNNDYLRLSNGERISGATFYATLEYFPFMQQFKIVQDDADACTVLLRVKEADDGNRAQVERVLRELLEGRIRYEIKYVDEIPMDPNGKTKILCSAIDREPICA